jgi:hypothetical protein
MPIVRLYHPHHQDGDDDCKVASAMVTKKRIVPATAKIMTKTTEIIMTMGGLLHSKRMYSQHMSVCIMGVHSDLLVRVLANRLKMDFVYHVYIYTFGIIIIIRRRCIVWALLLWMKLYFYTSVLTPRRPTTRLPHQHTILLERDGVVEKANSEPASRITE